jgi:predicted nucleic acid-binding protein
VRRICLYLSVLTLGEIRKGIASLRDASRCVTLEAWLDSDLVLRFAERILPIDHAVADRWGQISAPGDRRSAATALDQNLTLVTRNTQDIAVTGVPVFNPWSS